MKKETFAAGATQMKTKRNSIAGDMFMKRRALEPELCHFYDGSAALVCSLIPPLLRTSKGYWCLANISSFHW